MSYLATMVKSLVAGVTAFGTGLITAAAEDGITDNEWYIIIGGTLVSAAAVWTIPNKPAAP